MKSVLKLEDIPRPERSTEAEYLKSSMENFIQALADVEDAGRKTGREGLVIGFLINLNAVVSWLSIPKNREILERFSKSI